MRQKTENRITGWGGMIFGFLGLVGLPMLSVFVVGLVRSISIPLWAFLSFLFIVTAVVLLAFRNLRKDVIMESKKCDSASIEYEKNQQEWQARKKEMINNYDKIRDNLRQCRLEMQARDELVFKDGAYFRKSDTQLQQPFCRICYDFDEKLITVQETEDWISGESVLLYWCPRCEESHKAQVTLKKS